jgi:hypothetical protein
VLLLQATSIRRLAVKLGVRGREITEPKKLTHYSLKVREAAIEVVVEINGVLKIEDELAWSWEGI